MLYPGWHDEVVKRPTAGLSTGGGRDTVRPMNFKHYVLDGRHIRQWVRRHSAQGDDLVRSLKGERRSGPVPYDAIIRSIRTSPWADDQPVQCLLPPGRGSDLFLLLILNDEQGPLRAYLDECSANLRATPETARRDWGPIVEQWQLDPCSFIELGLRLSLHYGTDATLPVLLDEFEQAALSGVDEQTIDAIEDQLIALPSDLRERVYERFGSPPDTLPAVVHETEQKTYGKKPTLQVPDRESILSPLPEDQSFLPLPARSRISKANKRRVECLSDYIRRWRSKLDTSSEYPIEDCLFELRSVRCGEEISERSLLVEPPRSDGHFHLRVDESYRLVRVTGDVQGVERFVYEANCELLFCYDRSALFGSRRPEGDSPELSKALRAVATYERRFLEATLSALW